MLAVLYDALERDDFIMFSDEIHPLNEFVKWQATIFLVLNDKTPLWRYLRSYKKWRDKNLDIFAVNEKIKNTEENEFNTSIEWKKVEYQRWQKITTLEAEKSW